MTDALEILQRPEKRPLYMIAGWRQWADAGSISSGLPQYLIQETGAKRIGSIRPDGFYLFQIPGTHDLVRPVVQFNDGYPESLTTQRNELFYAEVGEVGIVFFLGDEPQLDMERYANLFLQAAQQLEVQRIISFGGVYGELPYNKERIVSCIYSKRILKAELAELAVNFSDYHGGASVGSYLCRRASERGLEYVGFYAFAPTYDFSDFAQLGNTIRIENDFMAWLAVMRRINHMLKTSFDLADLIAKSQKLIDVVDEKVDELAAMAPELSVHEYFQRLAENFEEVPFNPLNDVWEDALRHILDDSDET